MREDVERELESHIALRAEELERAGWSAAEARAEAERLFGDRRRVAARAQAEARVTRKRKDRWTMAEAFWRDVRLGARALGKAPGFTALAVATLALGIGANTAVFTVVSGVLLRQPPYPDAHELVVLWEQNESGREIPVSHPNFRDWREAARSFETLTTMPGGATQATVLGGTEPVRAQIDPVGADFFATMGVPAERGRVFGRAESRPGEAPVVVVSHAFWRDALGAPAELSDVTIRALGTSAAVTGVMPPGFDYPYGVDVWFPADQLPPLGTRTAHNYRVIGRLADGVTLESARAEMTGIARRLQAEHGPEENNAVDVVVRRLREERAGDTARTLLLLLGAAGFVLLIACANIASALLARGTGRVREVAVRIALGASRGRVIRQLGTESLLLAIAGGAVGVGLGWLLLQAILRTSPAALPVGTTLSLDLLVLAFALGVTLLTALVFGLGPSIRLSRTPPGALIRNGDRGASGRVRGGTWSALVAAEVALALVLLVGAGLLVRSFDALLRVDPGYDTSDVLTARLALPTEVYPEEADVAGALASFREEIGRIPGVVAVGGAIQIPLATGGMDGAMEVEGRQDYGYAEYRVVLPGYFEALDIPVVTGRVFEPADHHDAPHVAVVNRALAEEYWPGESPIGRRIRGTTNDRYVETWMPVVGVVENVRHESVLDRPRPELYVSALQRPNRASYTTLTIETAGDPAALAAPVRGALQRAAPQVPADLETYASIAARDVADRRFAMALISGFAGLALLLATLGIYGVVSYAVTRRTREIGIRIALGAAPGRVARAVQREMLVPVAAGAGAGIVGAVLLSRLVEGLLFGVEPLDPATFLAVTAILVATGALAAWVPARRSARVDPREALTAE